uniref:Uncharacterized protein ycf33 n=1 Tax=Porphyridium sordidum TaxID=28024 RepID=A0A1C9CDM4_PORSO|nr:hypothetical protein Psor_015 [Porphyridium sordidum]AOM66490.1 hypothetical protein Psor_015 [Porphyridium sordidum]
MNEFIENVIRLMRFFISSMLGLLVTVFGPFLNLINNNENKNTFVLFSLLLTIILIFYFILTKMLDI